MPQIRGDVAHLRPEFDRKQQYQRRLELRFERAAALVETGQQIAAGAIHVRIRTIAPHLDPQWPAVRTGACAEDDAEHRIDQTFGDFRLADMQLQRTARQGIAHALAHRVGLRRLRNEDENQREAAAPLQLRAQVSPDRFKLRAGFRYRGASHARQ